MVSTRTTYYRGVQTSETSNQRTTMLPHLALSLLLLSPLQDPPPDVIVLLLDDVGQADVDAVPTPNIDALALQGVKFTRAYAHAWCQPTRASLAFGLTAPPFFGHSCDATQQPFYPEVARPSVYQMANLMGYETNHIGKIHLGDAAIPAPWEVAPHFMGIQHVRAYGRTTWPNAGACSLHPQHRVDDGVLTANDPTHRLIRERDALLSSYQDAKANGRPYFAICSFIEAHSPWAVPPAEVMPSGYVPTTTARGRYEAEIVGLDFVIGEIANTIDLNTTWLWIMGDNGTPPSIPLPGMDGKVKPTVFEGGVRVPLIVLGPGIQKGVESDALVHVATDFAPTLAFGLGIPAPWAEGTSYGQVLKGCVSTVERDWLFVVREGLTVHEYAVVERRWKMHLDDVTGAELFFDLENDPTESNPLDPLTMDPVDVARLRAEMSEALGR